MKKLFFFIIFSITVFSQVPTTYNLELYTGDNTTFQFLTSTDISTSRLLFVVKANDVIYSARLIEKKNTIYGGSDSEIKSEYYKAGRYRTFVYLEGSDTDTLDAEFYHYDLVKIDPTDSTIQVTLYTGRIQFKHQIQSPYDNTYVDERAVFRVKAGTIQNELLTWDIPTANWIPSGSTGGTGSTGGLFEADGNGDLMPNDTTATDAYYELDGNGDIQPL